MAQTLPGSLFKLTGILNYQSWTNWAIKYCRANQEWQWRTILFTIVKYFFNWYTPPELTRIDISLVY